MPLYDPEHTASAPPEDAIAVVHDFLGRCRVWAEEREIPKRLARVERDLEPADVASLHQWVSWLRFVEHAISELEDGTLDHWFEQKEPGNSG